MLPRHRNETDKSWITAHSEVIHVDGQAVTGRSIPFLPKIALGK
jgi:hypothetical protein